MDVRIHSGGGSVTDGFVIYNTLSKLTASVRIFIDGVAASMASVIACIPNAKVHIPANAWIMVHKPWGGLLGDSDELRDYADLLDRNEINMLAAYERKTGKSRDEIKQMLKPDTWLSGQDAIEQGFADVLLDPLQAAASINPNRIKELDTMPNALKTLMAPQANTPAPAPVPAPQPQPAAPQAAAPTAPPAPDEAAIRAQIMAAEQTRRTEITELFALTGNQHQELMATCLQDMNTSPAQARAKLLEALGQGTTPTQPNHRITAHAGNGNLVGDSVRASVLARAGLAEVQADNAYNHMSLRELARASLVDRGIGVATLNPMQMVGQAFTHTTSDFGLIMMDVANKSMLQGWDESEETFQRWTKRGQLSDFKIARRLGMGEFAALREVREGAEYKHITLGSTGESIVLATYGEMFSITRQAIINDDMSALTDIPSKMGAAAKATIGDLVYATLTSGPSLSDGKSIFDATRKNTLSGAPTVENLDKARQLMRVQKTMTEGGKPRTLNIRPAFVLVPTALESTTGQVIKSVSVKGADINAGIANPIQNFAEVIGEPRLDDDSATKWYLAARQGTDTIEVAYLNGIDTPYMEQQQGFTVDGVATKVRIDAGVAPLDYRGLVRSNG